MKRWYYRNCAICKKGPDEYCQMIVPCKCNPGSNYVHSKCLVENMQSTNKICCDRCHEKFMGIEYSYEKKNLFAYLLEVPEGRNKLVGTVSLFVSMLMSLSLLYRTVFVEWADFVEDVRDFDYCFTLQAFKHNLQNLVMFNNRLILPFLTMSYTIKNIKEFCKNFEQWSDNNYSIAFAGYIDNRHEHSS